MPDSDVIVIIHHDQIALLGAQEEMRRALERSVRPNVAVARARAPHRTGAGATSIRAETVLDGGLWEVHVAWDRDHYYMGMHERGTRRGLEARPFLAPAFR